MGPWCHAPPVEKFRKIITVTVTVMEYLWENCDQQIEYLRKVQIKNRIKATRA